jgi:hypothetical protein
MYDESLRLFSLIIDASVNELCAKDKKSRKKRNIPEMKEGGSMFEG